MITLRCALHGTQAKVSPQWSDGAPEISAAAARRAAAVLCDGARCTLEDSCKGLLALGIEEPLFVLDDAGCICGHIEPAAGR
jgi:hypothetical protein